MTVLIDMFFARHNSHYIYNILTKNIYKGLHRNECTVQSCINFLNLTIDAKMYLKSDILQVIMHMYMYLIDPDIKFLQRWKIKTRCKSMIVWLPVSSVNSGSKSWWFEPMTQKESSILAKIYWHNDHTIVSYHWFINGYTDLRALGICSVEDAGAAH